MMQVTKVWWDGKKLMAEPIDPAAIYKEPEQPAQQEPGRNHWEDGDVFERIAASKKQPAQQEPVAWANPNDLQNFDMKVRINGGPLHTVPLYTSPPAQRTWVGLTSMEKRQLFEREDYQGWLDYINVIEAKLKEKNT